MNCETVRIAFVSRLAEGVSVVVGIRLRLRLERETKCHKELSEIGPDELVQCVRYSIDDNWSQLFLLREISQQPVSAQDRPLVDLAMTSIVWLHATADETFPSVFGPRGVMVAVRYRSARHEIYALDPL